MVKWMRDIPGPLNAIMKADTRAISHGHNDSDSADQDASRITSCFDHGPWVDMCRYINIDAKYGELYGKSNIASQGIALNYKSRRY